MKRIVWALSLILAVVISGGTGQAAEPLPSWQDGNAKAAIIDFVEQVTQEGGPQYVPPAKRIAVLATTSLVDLAISNHRLQYDCRPPVGAQSKPPFGVPRAQAARVAGDGVARHRLSRRQTE